MRKLLFFKVKLLFFETKTVLVPGRQGLKLRRHYKKCRSGKGKALLQDIPTYFTAVFKALPVGNFGTFLAGILLWNFHYKAYDNQQEENKLFKILFYYLSILTILVEQVRQLFLNASRIRSGEIFF